NELRKKNKEEMNKELTEINEWNNGTKLFTDNVTLKDVITKYFQPELEKPFQEKKELYGSLIVENQTDVHQLLKQLATQQIITNSRQSEIESSIETPMSFIKEEINKYHNQIEKLYELNIITENEYTEYCTYLKRMEEMNNEQNENIKKLTKREVDNKK
ncbi:hypothetical protein EDI_302600, partial [Entamoeba dispar SAW760]